MSSSSSPCEAVRVVVPVVVCVLAASLSCQESVPEIGASECAPLDTALEPSLPDLAGRVVGEPTDEATGIYDPTQLRTYELLLSEEDLAFLDGDPTAEEYVPGTLRFEGTDYPVAIRYKGSLGAFLLCTEDSTPTNPFNIGGAKTCPKLSLKVSFNRYDPSGRFFGLKKLLFHAMNNDASMMRERLAYWLFRQMNVPAPRAVHARVYINGEYAGVFANVEQIDGRFTRSRFADGEGNLYKEVWPTTNELTPTLTRGRLLSGLRTNEDEDPSVDAVLEFSRGVAEPGTSRARTLQDWMSVENTAAMFAVDRTIRADDGPFHFYCAGPLCENHNFYVYEEQFAQRLWLIPWDMDTAFVVVSGGLTDVADTFLKVVSEWDDNSVDCEQQPGGAAWTPRQMPPACDPLINGYGCYFRDRYEASVNELLAGPFSEATVEAQITAWQQQIYDSVAEAHALDPEQPSVLAWEVGIDDLLRRTRSLRSQAAELAGP